jgi:Na+-transporting NADH:ubiquinone oxidoreductase subunit NqrA
MTLLRLDSVKKMVSWIVLLPLTILTSTQAEMYDNHLDLSKIIDVQSLISESTLNCSFDTSSEELIGFYTYFLENSSKEQKYGQFIIGNRYKVKNVKSINSTFKKKKNEISKNMDTDFKKFGVRVLRISSFSQNGDDENFGYYIILKDKPSFNKSILQKHKIELTYSTIEETIGGNTRIRCTLVG